MPLEPDEEVLARLHPHWKELVGPALVLPMAAGAVSFGVTAMPAGAWQPAARWAVLGVGVLVVVWWSVRPWLRWQATVVLVTTRRVALRTGVLSRHGRDVPLSRISDLAFERSVLQRLTGCGTLVVTPSGEAPPLVLRDLPGIESVQDHLHRLMEPSA